LLFKAALGFNLRASLVKTNLAGLIVAVYLRVYKLICLGLGFKPKPFYSYVLFYKTNGGLPWF